jgi:hypothetical protein
VAAAAGPPSAAAALKQFTEDFAKITPPAHQLQAYVRNVAIFNATVNYVAQAIAGTLSEAEAYNKITEEVATAVRTQ